MIVECLDSVNTATRQDFSAVNRLSMQTMNKMVLAKLILSEGLFFSNAKPKLRVIFEPKENEKMIIN